MSAPGNSTKEVIMTEAVSETSASDVKPRAERALARYFPELAVAGFSRFDAAMNFSGFVNALLRPDMTVVDFGAGRGGMLVYTEAPYRTRYQTLRGKAARVIGVDIDPAVNSNLLVDEAIVIEPGGTIPLADQSVHLVVSLSTFEHIADPAAVEREFRRIVKPGGWVCAHTPNKYGYVAVGARLIPNALHKRVLRRIQPQRPSIDVFPTLYRLNTRRAVRRVFASPHWRVFMFAWNGEPCYLEDNYAAVWLLSFASKHVPEALGTHWSIFIRREP
jgi:SAM-dependent methyltransferase